MINRLTEDIKSYIQHLEKNGIYISIQTEFSEYMLPLIDYYIHRNPKCLVLKSDEKMWDKCISYHNNTMVNKNEYEIKKCHAGICEALFGLECYGNIRATWDKDYDEAYICTLIKPLCRMVEYLEMLIPKNESEITENELVNRCIKFLQRNFSRQLTNSEIAKFCSCSESSLCHLFKKHTGVSLHTYISTLRISRAKELLSVSNQSVSSVAVKSGFPDYNYFAIRFKKETGLSPSEYRKKQSKNI